ncbi:disease resistance protein RML1A isoform X2 [Morus notabilis]|uniref:disease resistance protein RML1A isoform X2 n=1 Tax=Morus notabilis TaxID=981085 RepID=UPI000CED403C|nr:disease resistance protein RML1A isoform X2 [Morus notabilis]
MAAGGGSSSKINYDVFISFRGEDTRSNFTSHLHSALCRAKIKAFIDENDLNKGNEISPTLSSAIKESKLCLIILSKNYASSRWCLDELAHILQCKKTDGQSKVLPVFYNVDRLYVKEQKGSYADAFAKHKERFEDEKLQAWREALTKIADLPGWDSNSSRLESTLVDKIVDDVIEKLKDISMAREDYLQGLVGVTKRIEEIESRLHIGSLDVRSVGIWGLGGIGKTTLARVVFCRLSSQFEACSFLENIREESKKHEPNHLKNKLYSELLKVGSPHSVTLQFEKDRLRRKRVLIVFDDVDDPQQLEQLFNASWFGPGSRIIVTSRDQQVLRNIGVSRTFEVDGLEYVEALELFSLHAFKRNSPTADKDELSRRIAKYAGGLPLALKVLGCRLFSKSIEEWESTLGKLQKIPDKKILSVLKLSYDSLDDTQQDLFLDIACFFKGEKRDLVQKILDACDLFATEGIPILIDKALITISGNSNTIWMHDLIQMMAFEIVSLRSTNQDPRKGSRLWTADDIYHALKNGRGIETITGISLDTSNFSREISLLPATFLRMWELRLLRIIDTGKLYLPQGPLIFPNPLRYLQWHGYPLKSLSTNFIAEMLVILDMRGSQLEKLWEGVQHLNKLKSMDLSGSMKLTQVPDLSLAPNIQSVNLMFCASLKKVPSYFQHLNKLKKLNLRGCPSLCKLSGLPKNLRTLDVQPRPVIRASMRPCDCSNGFTWCLSPKFSSKLERFPEISHPMECIETLTLDSSAIKELPFSIKNLTGLKRLSLDFCENLEFLPDSFHCLSSLQYLSLTCCRKLESLPRLPLSLSFIEASCCTSLKKVSSSIDLVNQNWDDYFFNNGYFKWHVMRFLGCDMLDENARKVINEEVRFRILRFATLYSNLPLDIISTAHFHWPESKIPWWFSHKSDVSSLSINLPHPDQWYNNSYLGLAACVILEIKDIISFWRGYEILPLYCDYVYMFPNGNSWRRTRSGAFFVPFGGVAPNFCDCCNSISTDGMDYRIHHNPSMNNCQHVFMFADPTYGKFLELNDGQIDASGNMKNRNIISYLGEYVKADQGSSDSDENEESDDENASFDLNRIAKASSDSDASFDLNHIAKASSDSDENEESDDENASFDLNRIAKASFDPTAAASFSFYLYDENEESDLNRIAKVVKCGVHFLYTHETERFESNQEPELVLKF